MRSEYESKLFEDVVFKREIEREMMMIKRMGHFRDGKKVSFVALGMKLIKRGNVFCRKV